MVKSFETGENIMKCPKCGNIMFYISKIGSSVLNHLDGTNKQAPNPPKRCSKCKYIFKVQEKIQ